MSNTEISTKNSDLLTEVTHSFKTDVIYWLS